MLVGACLILLSAEQQTNASPRVLTGVLASLPSFVPFVMFGLLLAAFGLEVRGRRMIRTVLKESEADLSDSESALARERRLLQCVLESIGEGIIVVDRSGAPFLWNPAAEKILGHASAELARKDWSKRYQFYDADGKTPIEPMNLPLERAARGEVTESYLICLRGERLTEEIWLSGSAQPVRGESGTVLGGVVVFTDVTEKKRSRELLKANEDQIRLLVESTAEGIYAVDTEDKCTFCNPAGVRLLGFQSAGEILGKTMHDLMHHSHADGSPFPNSECSILNSHRLGRNFHVDDEVFWRADGTPMEVEYWSRPIVRDGRAAGAVVAFHDITSRKQAQRALELQTRQLQALFDNAMDAVVVVDDDGRIADANPAACSLFGLTRSDMLGRNLGSSLEPANSAKQWQKFLEGKYRGLGVLSRPEGERRQLDISITSNFWPGRHLGIFRDVTDQKNLEDQLRQSQKMEAIGRLAGGIAHDFNNLLNVIGGYNEILQMKLSDGTVERSYTDKVMQATRKAASLTRQLLAFSRKQMLAPTVLDPNFTIADLGKLLPRLIGEDIELTFNLQKDLHRVKVDASQLEQVLMNLAVNARDAMPTGGKLTIETANVTLDQRYAATHISAKPGEYVMVAVSDTGVGMSEAIQCKIFEPFFTTKEMGKGTGLGLSTVYGVVKQSGGYIWVYSEIGKGTTFKVYFPAVLDAGRDAIHPAPAEAVTSGTETVLLVEDKESLLSVAKEYLTGKGYTVLDAANGAAALDVGQAHNGQIDILVTDVIMPKLGGSELVKQIHKVRPNLKVIYVSGYTEDTIGHHGVLDEGVNFVQKPYSLEGLAKRIREVLDGTEKVTA